MRMSEQIDQLAVALAAAQANFPTIPKDKENPYFKSKYADLSSVVEAVKPTLAAHGLSVVQLIGADEHGDLLTTTLIHKSGQWIADSMRLRPVKPDPQAQGSAITYARRYALQAVLGVVADDDDDGQQASAPAKRQSASRQAPPRQAAPPPEGAHVRQPPQQNGEESSGPMTREQIEALKQQAMAAKERA